MRVEQQELAAGEAEVCACGKARGAGAWEPRAGLERFVGEPERVGGDDGERRAWMGS